MITKEEENGYGPYVVNVRVLGEDTTAPRGRYRTMDGAVRGAVRALHRRVEDLAYLTQWLWELTHDEEFARMADDTRKIQWLGIQLETRGLELSGDLDDLVHAMDRDDDETPAAAVTGPAPTPLAEVTDPDDIRWILAARRLRAKNPDRFALILRLLESDNDAAISEVRQ